MNRTPSYANVVGMNDNDPRRAAVRAAMHAANRAACFSKRVADSDHAGPRLASDLHHLGACREKASATMRAANILHGVLS